MIRRILLIDDEEAIRIIVQAAIEATTNWEILVTDCAQSGLRVAESQQPDVILCDVMMPELDGAALFHRLQNNPLTQSIPVIFLTAKVIQSEQQQLKALGAAGVITKPFEVEAIANQIKTLLHWPN